ncbi:MAG: UDP-2,3-diacylglucosamine diphosphatase [Bdellovibrionales bacterium]
MLNAIFLSDLHLTTLSDPRGQCFLRLLHSQRGPRAASLSADKIQALTHLFLVGDIFDLWLADHTYFLSHYASAIEQIRRLHNEGVEIHYFEGNHDLYLEKFWGQALGVEVHAGPAYFQLGSRRVRVEHGDQMDPDDRGYLFLRWLLRTSVMTWLAHHLPSKAAVLLGQRASQTSRTYTSQVKTVSHDQALTKMHRHAENLAQSESFDLMIHGHVHVQDDYIFEVCGKPIRSINLGSWLGGQMEYLVLNEKELKFVSLQEQGSFHK